MFQLYSGVDWPFNLPGKFLVGLCLGKPLATRGKESEPLAVPPVLQEELDSGPSTATIISVGLLVASFCTVTSGNSFQEIFQEMVTISPGS